MDNKIAYAVALHMASGTEPLMAVGTAASRASAAAKANDKAARQRWTAVMNALIVIGTRRPLPGQLIH